MGEEEIYGLENYYLSYTLHRVKKKIPPSLYPSISFSCPPLKKKKIAWRGEEKFIRDSLIGGVGTEKTTLIRREEGEGRNKRRRARSNFVRELGRFVR